MGKWISRQLFSYEIHLGKQGWRSGESSRLPPMCSGFDSRTRRRMWVEFVVGSLLFSLREVFLRVLRFSPLLNSSLESDHGVSTLNLRRIQIPLEPQ